MITIKWDENSTQTLIKMHRKGSTSGEIVKALRHRFTRNAVVGKIHRLRAQGKLDPPFKGSDAEKEHRARQIAVAKRLAAPQHKISNGFGPAAMPGEPTPPRPLDVTRYDNIDPKTPGLLRITDLKAHHCRWPLNNALGGEYYFCGADRHKARAYCETHAAIAYIPKAKTREDKGAS